MVLALTKHDEQRTKKNVPLTLLILWLHFFWCLYPSWRDGQYYSYGFFVAPLAIMFAWRRWSVLKEAGDGADKGPRTKTKPKTARLTASLGLPSEEPRTKNQEPHSSDNPQRASDNASKHSPWPLRVMIGLFLVLMIPLRMVEIGDPTWRPPLWIHAAMVVGLCHWLLLRQIGWKGSWFFVPVTIFALTAVPYPWQIEQALVRQLTDGVIGLTREVFLMDGQPVQRMGEMLVLGDQVCEVTEGCSGIRSIQSLVMAALFFGELLWLRWPSRIALLGVGLVSAVVCNVGRAWYLATVQFSKGIDAAHAAHDGAGHVAFAVAALILFGVARLLMPRARGRVVRRTAVKAGASS